MCVLLAIKKIKNIYIYIHFFDRLQGLDLWKYQEHKCKRSQALHKSGKSVSIERTCSYIKVPEGKEGGE